MLAGLALGYRDDRTAPRSSGCSKIKCTPISKASFMTSKENCTSTLLSSNFCCLAPSSQGKPQTCSAAARSGRGPHEFAQGALLHPAQGGDKTTKS